MRFVTKQNSFLFHKIDIHTTLETWSMINFAVEVKKSTWAKPINPSRHASDIILRLSEKKKIKNKQSSVADHAKTTCS